ncbi:type II toxin-antitoxin system VapB family antitoxin [Mucilaginibacter gilvus]|uniref:Type II toxin-antitoxin system VapB family antitoxin n=1 Tax=Mucilaginibacter gilvus TaxID=2305909 RepID=A0A444MS69_9SPHI|nr:type II toxin-antitoxin system VapB family antitoxin [Mucilaginibacter gilvus]RWY55441.1 hypothetical protein EPL05_03450 [Mucilaginibacter gilvus]
MTIDIDANLLAKAKEISGISDKYILIEKALQLYIALEGQKLILDIWNKVEFDDKDIHN